MPPHEPKQRPWWQHPFTVIGVAIGIGLVLVAAFSFDSPSDTTRSAAAPNRGTGTPAPTPEFPDEDDEPAIAPDPDEAGPLLAPPPVQRIEVTRPDRTELWNAAITLLDSRALDSSTSIADTTWSGCSATEQTLSEALNDLLQPYSSSRYEFGVVLVVSENFGVVEVVVADEGIDERLVFVREQEQWRSGFCSDPSADLQRVIELPDDLDALVRLAGLDYENESLFQQPLQSRDLAYANFAAADLTRSNMAGSVLEAATFRGADLTEAWLAGATTASVGADFTDTTLVSAFFPEADLTGSRFDGANAVKADFSGAILTAVSFAGADLTGAFIDLSSARSVADWSFATCPDGETAEDPTGCESHLNPYG